MKDGTVLDSFCHELLDSREDVYDKPKICHRWMAATYNNFRTNAKQGHVFPPRSTLGLIHQDLGLQIRIMRQERIKQLDAMLDVVGSARLADGVHAQLRVAQVQSANAHFCGQHRANSATARAVVAYDEQLQRDAGLLGDFLEEDDARGVGGVSLVCVDLKVLGQLSSYP